MCPEQPPERLMQDLQLVELHLELPQQHGKRFWQYRVCVDLHPELLEQYQAEYEWEP